jgi:hypothetical protein
MMIFNQSTTGELWAERNDGGVEHLGTYHMDSNIFEESDQDGIQGDEHNVSEIADGEWIEVQGGWKLYKDDFETFRLKWLAQKFPSIDWWGGREIRDLPNALSLGPGKGIDGGRGPG